MGKMDLTVRHTGHASAMECTTPQGATITFDDPDEGTFGGSPMQHLLAAIGACALIDIVSILRKKRLTFTNLRVECHADRRDAPDYPRVFQNVAMTFHVDGDVPAKAFDQAVQLSVEKYCSVGGTVREGAPTAWEAVVHPPA